MSAAPNASTGNRGGLWPRLLAEGWTMLRITAREWWEDNTFRYAASLAFYTIFSLAPVLLIAVGAASGALVTAVLFTAGKYAIGLYMGRAAVGSAFGAAGSFVVLLFWVYYSALICFFGAEFTQVFARRHGAGIRPMPHARRVGRKPDRR